jgi:VanZ family protein
MRRIRLANWPWGPAIALMMAIFALSSVPGPQVGQAFAPLTRVRAAPAIRMPMRQSHVLTLPWPKIGHIVGYAGLGCACLYGLRRDRRRRLLRALLGGQPRAWRAQLLALLLATSYAGSDEFHQRFTPGRSAAAADVALDAAAAIAGVSLWTLAAAARSYAATRDRGRGG